MDGIVISDVGRRKKVLLEELAPDVARVPKRFEDFSKAVLLESREVVLAAAVKLTRWHLRLLVWKMPFIKGCFGNKLPI